MGKKEKKIKLTGKEDQAFLDSLVPIGELQPATHEESDKPVTPHAVQNEKVKSQNKPKPKFNRRHGG